MTEIMEYCSIPVIAALCFVFIEVIKRTFQNDDKLKNAYPLISAVLGSVLGIVAFWQTPLL